MRTIRSGEKTFEIRGSNLALIYHQQSFQEDAAQVASSLAYKAIYLDKLSKLNPADAKSGSSAEILQTLGSLDLSTVDIGTLDFSAFLLDGASLWRLLYSMARAQAKHVNREIKGFEDWCLENDDIHLKDIQRDVLEEAVAGFFR